MCSTSQVLCCHWPVTVKNSGSSGRSKTFTRKLSSFILSPGVFQNPLQMQKCPCDGKDSGFQLVKRGLVRRRSTVVVVVVVHAEGGQDGGKPLSAG